MEVAARPRCEGHFCFCMFKAVNEGLVVFCVLWIVTGIQACIRMYTGIYQTIINISNDYHTFSPTVPHYYIVCLQKLTFSHPHWPIGFPWKRTFDVTFDTCNLKGRSIYSIGVDFDEANLLNVKSKHESINGH